MRTSVLSTSILLVLASCEGDKVVNVRHSEPRVSVTSPAEGTTFEGGEPITFSGAVEDDRDANTDLAIVWTSDRDGELNTDPADADGNVEFTTANLSAGIHVVTLQVTNSDALSAEDFVTIEVTEVDQDPEISVRSPSGTDYGVEGVTFTFEAMVADAQDEGPDLTVWFASDLDGTFCEPVPDLDGYAACDATLSAGDHTLTFGVIDVDGNEITADTFFTVVAADASDDDRDGYTEDDGDCDDTDPSVHPGATEYPNGVDDDCDEAIDEGTSSVDDDGDGFSEEEEDCDDGDPDSWPGAPEVCDDVDNDCDLTVDDGTSCYDDDLDGYTEADGDCDDADDTSFPGGSEIGDAADNDCDGTADEGTTLYDDDGDCACESGVCTGSIEAGCSSLVEGDCDDDDDAISPSADELCNDVDDDCDGTADEAALDESTWYADADADLYGDAAVTATGCDAPSGYVANDEDCDDTDPDTSPAATETCDGFDEDCDGSVDEDDASDASTWYLDADGDGYGLATSTTRACALPTGYASVATDCNDGSASINPAMLEECDSVDNDCDGTVDEDDAIDAGTWYADADGDGYGGTSSASTVSCSRPSGYSSVATDCNDAAAGVSPAASEVCDGTDNDCDGALDDGVTTTYYRDADGDGYGTSGTTSSACSAPTGYVTNSSDCDDTDATLSPDTVWYRDSDSDGYGDASATRSQCTQPSGYVDDADDCNDATASASPADTESCDGIDNDCDGSTDERNASGCTAYYVDADADGYGEEGTSSRCYCEATSTYTATNNDDCYDDNSNANPAATAYYTTDRGDGSYDYNCDGTASKRYTDNYECTGAVYVCIDWSAGWTSSTDPACGSTGRWGTSCSADLTSCSYSSSTSRTQSCR